MSRNTKRKEVTKQAVLAELESLRQGRHARYQTLAREVFTMPGLATSRLSMRSRRRCKHSHSQPHATRCASRLASTGQLMAPGTGLC